jgi:KTSC domain-containing protein
MNGTAVESTTLAEVGYDEARETLRLEFRSRGVYLYYGVPGPVHQALLGAASKGRYFNEAIRGRFRYARAAKAQPGEV